MSRRVLVVAHEHATDELVQRLLAAHSGDDEFVVVAPVLVSGLRYWTNDDTEARRTAAELVRSWVDALTNRRVRGHLGDANQMQAIDDALALFAPDEVAIVGPAGDVEERARRRFSLPVPRTA
jgi:hypothetical protein